MPEQHMVVAEKLRKSIGGIESRIRPDPGMANREGFNGPHGQVVYEKPNKTLRITFNNRLRFDLAVTGIRRTVEDAPLFMKENPEKNELELKPTHHPDANAFLLRVRTALEEMHKPTQA